MKINVIKREIPAEISEAGGAYLQFVDKQTVELETSIDEAKNGLYVVGDKLLIKGYFTGLMRSAVDGISRDGLARQLGDFLTIYPVVKGEIDLDKGWDDEVNSISIKARLLNEMTIDISDWEFVDVTEGRKPFKLESVKAGAEEKSGTVVIGEGVEMNGDSIPATADIRVEWAVEETGESGTIPAAKVTSTCTRVDITGDALAGLATEAHDGKTIVFTVRGNKAKATVKATLKFVEPTEPTITKVVSSAGEGKVKKGASLQVTGYKIGPDDIGDNGGISVRYATATSEGETPVDDLSYDEATRTWTTGAVDLGEDRPIGAVKIVVNNSSGSQVAVSGDLTWVE